MTTGKVKVGRCIPHKYFTPEFNGYSSIIVMVKKHNNDEQYGDISPYYIKVQVPGFPNGVIHENYWQFLKVYNSVEPIESTFSLKDTRIAWKHEGCIQLDEDNNITPAWNDWRLRGFASNNYIRFPVGSNPKKRASCQFALTLNTDGSVNTDNKLDYVQSRKQTYVTKYCENVKNHNLFLELKQRLLNGENLLIIEPDGPHQESLLYYKNKYNVNNDFIINHTVDVTIENMQILINDTKHAFGHGYCLAMELLEITESVINL